MPHNYKDFFTDFFYKIVVYGTLAVFGNVALQINEHRKGKKIKWHMRLGNLFLAIFVGYILGNIIPESSWKNSALSISGFLAYPILNFIEKDGLSLLFKKMGGKDL